MDDTVSGLWNPCEILEAERLALQRKLEIAVEALKSIRGRAYPNGVPSSMIAFDALFEIKKLEEK